MVEFKLYKAAAALCYFSPIKNDSFFLFFFSMILFPDAMLQALIFHLPFFTMPGVAYIY